MSLELAKGTKHFMQNTQQHETAGARQKIAKSTLESIKLACLAYEALQPLNNISWTSHREKLLSLCKAEERDHRGFMSDFTSCHTADTASVSDAAKLMAVKRVAEYMQGDKMPKGKDFLHYQTSCFYAAGLVDEFREVIAKAWIGFDVQDLADLDYTTIVKVRKVA